MDQVEPSCYHPSSPEEPLRQGEILTNLVLARLALESIGSTDEAKLDPVVHPYAIIVTQDCDLDLDFRARHGEIKADKLIPSILFAEVDTAKNLHGRKDMGSDIWRQIKKNRDERYHFLQSVKPAEDALGTGLPELGVDFKRYFTIPSNEVYARLAAGEFQRRCRLVSPYLEHFSTRFAYFQCRVALPEQHYSEPM